MWRHRSLASSARSSIRNPRRILSIARLLCLGALAVVTAGVIAAEKAGCTQTSSGGKRAPSKESLRPTQNRNLEAGGTVQQSLKGKQQVADRLYLASGQLVRLACTPFNLDIIVSIISPEGKKVAELDTTDGPGGPRSLFWIAQRSGTYLVQVRSSHEAAARGKYQLEVKEVRPTTSKDPDLIEAQTLYFEAEKLRRMGDGDSLQHSISKYQRSAALWEAVLQPSQQAESLKQLGDVLRLLGQNKEALQPLNQALSLAQSAGDSAAQAAALHTAGQVYDLLSDEQKALEVYNQALPMQLSDDFVPQRADTLNDIGNVYDDLGQGQTALSYYRQALVLKHQIGNRADEGAILSNIGIVYDDFGDRQAALDCYKASADIERALHQLRTLGTDLNNIGFAYHASGDERKALDYYEQALPLAEETKDRLDEGRTLSNIARSYENLGEYQRALEYFNRALLVKEAAGDKRGLAYTFSFMGDTYLQLGEYDKARDHLNRGLLLSQQASAPVVEASTLLGIARLEEHSGNLFEAEDKIEKCLVIIEQLRSNVKSGYWRSTYLATVQPAYEFYINLLMVREEQAPNQGYSSKALEAGEKGRARSLLDVLAEAHVDIRRGVDPKLLGRERSSQQLVEETMNEEFRVRNQQHNVEELANVHRQLEVALVEHEAIEAEIRASSPKYEALHPLRPLDVSAIQSLLDSDTLLLEYFLGTEHSFVWAVTQNSLSSFVLPARGEIELTAKQLYSSLARGKAVGAGKATERNIATSVGGAYGERLSRVLLKPVTGLAEAKRLVIVGDGVLQYIPFGVLPEPEQPNPAQVVPLIDNHEVVNLPSATVLAALRQDNQGRPIAGRLLAVFADPVFEPSDQRVSHRQSAAARTSGSRNRGEIVPSLPLTDSRLSRSASDVTRSKDVLHFERLPFTRQEAASIVAMAPAGSSLEALDFQASRATATDTAIAQYRIVHFATHGLLDSERPELSGLVLSLVDPSGRPQNGFLELEDIYNLRLNADLVVLSACETGLGKDIKGEGLLGLTRGFMDAGAPRVVASLWNVDDVATAELMKRFYKFMLQLNQSPAAALRAAQLEISRQPRWADPYYWAGFTLQGEWR